MCSNGSGGVVARAASRRWTRSPPRTSTACSARRCSTAPPAAGRAQNRLDAELARTRPRGPSSPRPPSTTGRSRCRPGCAGTCGSRRRAAHRLVRTGRALEHLPAVAAAFADGRVTAEQVAVIAPVATPEEPGRGRRAGRRPGRGRRACWPRPPPPASYAQLGQVVHHYLARLDPDGPEPDPTEGRRCPSPSTPTAAAPAAFDLDAGRRGEGRRPRWSPSCRPTGPPGDDRTRAQQLADALVQLADNALAAGQPADPAHGQAARGRHHRARRPGRPAPPARAPPRTGFGARDLRRPGPLAGLRRQHHPHRHRPRGPAAGPRPHQAVVPAALRRAVDIRDRHCVFAGCHAPTYWCDVHHLLRMGSTTATTCVENSALLCERHHTKVHHGFRIEREPDGRWRTYRPDGTEILLHPDLLAG